MLRIIAIATLLQIVILRTPPLVLYRHRTVDFGFLQHIGGTGGFAVRLFAYFRLTCRLQRGLIQGIAVQANHASTTAIIMIRKVRMFLVRHIARFITTGTRLFNVNFFRPNIGTTPRSSTTSGASRRRHPRHRATKNAPPFPRTLGRAELAIEVSRGGLLFPMAF